MDECPRCGGGAWVDVHAMQDVHGPRICRTCGHMPQPDRSGCPRCDGDLAEVHVFTNAGPISQVCTSCGWNNRIMFVRWRGDPVHMVDPAWEPQPIRVISGPVELTSTRPPVLTIHCGPPADRPHPPTPEEILAAAHWLTMPGPGRVDLSDHRVYLWGVA